MRPVKDKENFEFKQVKFRLKIDIVSHPARTGEFIYVCVCVCVRERETVSEKVWIDGQIYIYIFPFF